MSNKNNQPGKGAAADTGARKFSKAKPLATRFGVCAKSIHRWANAGHIGRFKLNDRVVLFDEAEVEAFVQRCRIA